MDDEETGPKETEHQDHWPDFIPPDFEQSIGSAPKEPASQPPPTVSGPVLPPQPQQPRQQQPYPQHPYQQQPYPPHPTRPRSTRSNAGAGDRWFNRPPQPGTGRPSAYLTTQATPVTNALIMICVVVWLLQTFFPVVSDLVMLIPSVAAGEPWRFITSAFAHAPRSLTHIGFNMLTLLLVGRYLEPVLGQAKFLAVYLISALGGSAMFVLLAFPSNQGVLGGSNWNSGLVGASGAIFGLFGAYMVVGWTQRRSLAPMWILLGMNLVILFLFPGIAWTAHLGGFLAGAAATGAIALDLRRGRQGRPSLAWVGMGVVLGLIVLSLVIKYATVGV